MKVLMLECVGVGAYVGVCGCRCLSWSVWV